MAKKRIFSTDTLQQNINNDLKPVIAAGDTSVVMIVASTVCIFYFLLSAGLVCG